MASGDGRVMINKTFFEDEIKNKDGTTTIKCEENYSRTEIQQFVNANSKGDPILESVVQMMKDLNPPKQTGDTSPWGTGRKYSIARNDYEQRLYPDQIIYRQLPSDRSKKGIPTLPVDKTFTTQPHHPDIRKPYWNLWSLLGLFLSLKYKADPMSTTGDVFARLTIMYAWWCRELVPGDGYSYPSVSQCTWGRLGANDAFDLFLGHSCKGAKGGNFPPRAEGEKDHRWVTNVKLGRYNLLGAIVKRDRSNWSFDKSPDRIKKKEAGTRFGNCAETYPFLSLLENQPKEPTGYLTYGYALKWEYFDGPQKEYKPIKAKKNHTPPCSNCKELLRLCYVSENDVTMRFQRANWNDGEVRDRAGKRIVIK